MASVDALVDCDSLTLGVSSVCEEVLCLDDSVTVCGLELVVGSGAGVETAFLDGDKLGRTITSFVDVDVVVYIGGQKSTA